ncbi:MAG: molybdenum cofactor biosynthesis protein MoaE [Fibrobacteria bacterium]|nr:molybdenum cofactor biosynthesis protein MoaE [Fibrobacteria bacterium]
MMPSLFRISSQEIPVAELRQELSDPSAGGFACFEGWVRDHHEGRSVERLSYEAHPVLAVGEGSRILAEALERFPIRKALCVHRVGELAIGGVAIWAAVSSDHRREAFEACSWIVDQVKHRVPIWKKEWFTDGTVAWVRCERCAQGVPHSHTQPETLP